MNKEDNGRELGKACCLRIQKNHKASRMAIETRINETTDSNQNQLEINSGGTMFSVLHLMVNKMLVTLRISKEVVVAYSGGDDGDDNDAENNYCTIENSSIISSTQVTELTSVMLTRFE